MRITTSGAANRNVLYDRNPTSISTMFGQALAVAPHTSTARWTYTVPTGRKAAIVGAHYEVFRNSAATTGGDITSLVNAQNAFPVYFDVFNNTVGFTDRERNSGTMYLLAGQAITANDTDLSTGGSVSFTTSAEGTEFDA
jgi:hypothetical protein